MIQEIIKSVFQGTRNILWMSSKAQEIYYGWMDVSCISNRYPASLPLVAILLLINVFKDNVAIYARVVWIY